MCRRSGCRLAARTRAPLFLPGASEQSTQVRCPHIMYTYVCIYIYIYTYIYYAHTIYLSIYLSIYRYRYRYRVKKYIKQKWGM